MRNSPAFRFRFLRHLIHACLPALLLGISHAAELLKLELSSDRKTAQVTVPDGVTRVAVECKDARGNWQTYVSVHVVPGKTTFDLPAVGPKITWRAVAAKKALVTAKGKFPTGFYKGISTFGPTTENSAPLNIDYRGIALADMAVSNTAVATPQVVPETPAQTPVEADIWKIDGTRVYYFNQLRGLQVVDLAKPEDPRLIATLRLPAVGQDLYLLPGTGETRELVLLTDGSNKTDGPVTRIRIVQMTGDRLKITSTQNVPGILQDSRMIGNRLILATRRPGPAFPLALAAKSPIAQATTLSEWVIESGKAPVAGATYPIAGDSPLIAAGSDWLAVATTSTPSDGLAQNSTVTVFGIRPTGLVGLGAPIQTEGVIADKFKIQWSHNVLTTISEANTRINRWSPRTVLQNFRVWGPGVYHTLIYDEQSRLLGSLELARGESLHATRFAGSKAYIVTFRQVDPLWVVDLSDAKNPKVAGEIQVPGWSTHLEPLGDLLFSIGWESGGVAASLFDVADPAAPKLLRRISLGDSSWSEATWDEKALKVLPDAGLVLVPVVNSDGANFQQTSSVRILDLDIAGRDLKLRGSIAHAFEPRRAGLIDGAVVSISQRVLVTASIKDRDKPEVVSEVSLAWPTNRICDAGNYVLQIEDGDQPTARVSPADSLEQIVSETPLGEGYVRSADFRDGKLYVLRQTNEDSTVAKAAVIGRFWGGYASKLTLDVYDGSALPALSLLGSCSADIGTGFGVSVSDLLWPQPTRPAVVLASSGWPIFWDVVRPPIILDDPITLTKKSIATADLAILPPVYRPISRKARLLVFDVVAPETPTVLPALDFGGDEAVPGEVKVAGSGLVVVGTAKTKVLTRPYLSIYRPVQSWNAMTVLEVGTNGPAVARPEIDLPGKLFAVTDLTEKGFLAYTRSPGLRKKTSTIQVSASTGFDAFLVASREIRNEATVAAGGRRLFIGTETGIARFTLADDKTWIRESELTLGWRPGAMRCDGGKIFGITGKSVFAANSESQAAKVWKFPAWSLSLGAIRVAGDGDLLAPLGEYGALRLDSGN